MKKIITKLKDSIYNPNYYMGLLTKSGGYSYKYYFSFIALLSVLLTIILIIVSFIFILSSRINKISEKIIEYYPDELVITIKDGKATSNVEEPYFLKAPKELFTKEQERILENILVINTNEANFSIEEFNEYKTISLLKNDILIYYSKNSDSGNFSIQQLSRFSDITISNESISSFLEKARPFVKIFPIILSPFIVIFIFITLLLKMVYMFAGALPILLIAKIKGIKIKYWKAYHIGLHAMTLPILVNFVVFFLLGNSLLIFAIITLLMVAVNFKPQENK